MTAYAQTPSYAVTGFTVTGQGTYTLGYNFKPTQDIYVTSVGQWIRGTDTITGTSTAGIFDNSGVLLFSTPFTQANATIVGNTDVNGNQFRYTDVASQFSSSTRKLLANTQYTIGATGYNDTVIAQATNLTFDPSVTLTSVGLYTAGGFQRPVTTNAFNIYGANFQYSLSSGAAAATPEPGSVALLAGLGISGSVFALRRRKA